MRIYFAGIALIAMLSAGCTSDWDPARSGQAAESEPHDASGQAMPAATLASRTQMASFASLPDRGELLRYSPERKVRRSGAYTSHPVDISEAHALNAIASGELRLNTPDGKTVAVAFDRIEEHPDGNWTWVGQNENGEHAVLTFGERAVFGEISTGGRSFRVTTRRGGAWLVETDAARLAGGHGQRQNGPDFLLPPSQGGATAGMAMAGAKATIVGDSAVATKAVGVVDVALGYTNGLVSTYGSESAAVSRITSLVALANAAYQRSGVHMRIRLVRSVQVNFADNTDNADALQKLTGYNASTGQNTTPDPAFNALRKAREDYGADLVSLIRPHRSPEQDGCGIAWLLGAEQSAITAADAPFGYSVVSDGSDEDEGDGHTYMCSDYSLAHEIGHNMGQAHNQADSEYAGAHAYSYGHRETSSSGFYTIMAYPLANGSQVEIPYFANPSINYAAGRPTGVTNVSDNVRSMNQTMPIISTFRANVVPLAGVRTDIDGDGKSDVIFRNSSNGRNVLWKSANYATKQQLETISNQAWTIVGTGDFNKDGKADILWRNISTGANMIWRAGSYAQRQSLDAVTNLKWKIVGVGDFNGDGASDILWRHSGTGANLIWASANGGTRIAMDDVVGGGWEVAGVGDFNGDGKSDILWRSATSGKNTIWKSGNGSTRQSVATVDNLNWKIAGVGDFNGDGIDDILWRNSVSGANLIWLAANTSTRQAVASVHLGYFVAAIGDYDGDGRADILWRNSSSGRNIIWKSANTATRQSMTTVPTPAWNIFY